MSNSLIFFDDEELRAELKRREEEKKKPPSANTPRNVVWSAVYDYVTYTVSDIHRTVRDGGDVDLPKDFEHSIFEMVCEAIYGKKFWEWWNEQF